MAISLKKGRMLRLVDRTLSSRRYTFKHADTYVALQSKHVKVLYCFEGLNRDLGVRKIDDEKITYFLGECAIYINRDVAKPVVAAKHTATSTPKTCVQPMARGCALH